MEYSVCIDKGVLGSHRLPPPNITWVANCFGKTMYLSKLKANIHLPSNKSQIKHLLDILFDLCLRSLCFCKSFPIALVQQKYTQIAFQELGKIYSILSIFKLDGSLVKPPCPSVALPSTPKITPSKTLPLVVFQLMARKAGHLAPMLPMFSDTLCTSIIMVPVPLPFKQLCFWPTSWSSA